MLEDIFVRLVKWAPVVELLWESFDDPEEALDELREWEVRQRKARDRRMGRGEEG